MNQNNTTGGDPIVTFKVDDTQVSSNQNDFVNLNDNDLLNNNEPSFVDLNDNQNNNGFTQQVNQQSTNADNNDSNDPNTPVDAQGDVNNNQNTDSKDKKDQDNQDDYSNYSQTALFATLLKDSGIDLFDEITPDMEPEVFVNSFKQNIEQVRGAVIQSTFNELGEIAGYVQHVLQTGDLESLRDLNPAIQVEKYINVDLDDPNINTDTLENMVKTMYIYQGVAPDLADRLAKTDATDGVLGIKSKEAQNFFSEYKQAVIEQATQKFYNDQQLEEQRLLDHQRAIASSLKNTDKIGPVALNDEIRNKLFHSYFVKDQLVNYQDENGNNVQEYYSKYDILLHDTLNDPSKFVKLLYFLNNNFELDSVTPAISRKLNSDIVSAIDSKDKNRVVNSNNPITINNNKPDNVIGSIKLN